MREARVVEIDQRESYMLDEDECSVNERID